MNTYETVFIVRPDVTTEDIEKTIEFYKENITKHGGEIIKVEPWGKQTMAYEIENVKEGFYVLIQFKAETEYLDELDKRYRFNEDVIRFVIVRIDDKKFKLNPKKESSRPPRKPRPRRDDDGSDNRPQRNERPADKPAEKPAEKAEEKKSEEAKPAEAEKTEEAKSE